MKRLATIWRQLFVGLLLVAAVAWAAETVIDPANRRINGGLTVVGTSTLTGVSSIATGKIDVIDAGTALFNGTVQLAGNLISTATTQAGTCTLSSGTPSTCTATVRSGATCICAPVGATKAIALAGCAVGVSTTTLTITGTDSVTTVMNYWCF